MSTFIQNALGVATWVMIAATGLAFSWRALQYLVDEMARMYLKARVAFWGYCLILILLVLDVITLAVIKEPYPELVLSMEILGVIAGLMTLMLSLLGFVKFP